jgi:hypothetical protein
MINTRHLADSPGFQRSVPLEMSGRAVCPALGTGGTVATVACHQAARGLDGLEPRRGRGSNVDVQLPADYRAAARAALTIPAPKKELWLALP